MDLSIVIPAIRPDRWVAVYESAKLSCAKHSFEIIFVGPYDPPDELKDNPQIKYIEDWGTSCRCVHIGVLVAEAPIFARMDDDAILFPDGLDQAIDMYNSVNNPIDMILLRYREGENFTGAVHDNSYYLAKTAYHTRAILAGQPPKTILGIIPFEELNIPDHFLNAPVFLMGKDHFIDMGGYDCRFEHMAWGSHDLCYRVQRNGGTIHLSSIEVANIDWFGNLGGDHAPVEEAVQKNDGPLLKEMQQDPNIVNRIKIDFNNWKDSPEVWSRRFTEGKSQS